MPFIGVEVEQEKSAPPPKKNPGSAPVYHLYKHVLSKTRTARKMVRVLFLFLTRFHVNVARSNGNQQDAKIFPPKINPCVPCVRVLCKGRRRGEGHLYEVFLVLAKTRLI